MSLNRRTTWVVTAALLLVAITAIPAAAQYSGRDHTIRFRAGLFEPAGESAHMHQHHTATLLPEGQVLIVGWPLKANGR